MLPVYLLAAVMFIGYLLVRSNDKLRQREDARRCRVTVEEVVPAFQWPPRPKPAAAPERHLGKTRVGI